MTAILPSVKHEIIEYEFSDLGRVSVQLFQESAQIYRFLLKTGGIEHFEKLEQLGSLRSVHKAAHHSRWEYMMLQMHLIEQLREKSSISLSTSIKLPNINPVSSVEELLKSWIFLNNYGHLKDTFEAERVWFELILETPQLRRVLYDAMPDVLCRRFADILLDEEDLYNFHHLIAIALIEWQKQKTGGSNEHFDVWIEMIKSLLKGSTGIYAPAEGSTLFRALEIFHALRRVSYVLLDINSFALFLKIDSHNLLRNILSEPETLLYCEKPRTLTH